MKGVAMTLYKLEHIFPLMVNLSIHLESEVKLGGLIQYGWMYPIERIVYIIFTSNLNILFSIQSINIIIYIFTSRFLWVL